MIVIVKDIVGEVCMTREDGQRLHTEFREHLDAGQVVTLDFQGTTTFISAFFNTAVGPLLEAYARSELSEKLKFVHVPDTAVSPLKKTIDQAEKYYSDPGYRSALGKALIEQSRQM